MGEHPADRGTLAEQHRSLRGTIDELQAFLDAPRPDIGDQGHADWTAAFTDRIVELHDRVSRHFRREESSGVLEQLERDHPRYQHQIQALRRDHDRILDDLRTLVGSALMYGCGEVPANPQLRRWSAAILDRLSQHEQEETEIFQRAQIRDLGSGD